MSFQWRYHIPILIYHRIGDALKGDPIPAVSSDAFKRQMELLNQFRANVLTLDEAARYMSDSHSNIPRRAVTITFDDGCLETYTNARPHLRRLSFPSAIFVTPSYIGKSGFMTWDQVIEMADNNCIIGSHTMNHTYLPNADADQLPEEVIESKRVIEEHIKRPVEYFSYPVGGFTSAVQTVVQSAGYRAAVTTNRIISGKTFDRFAIRRIKVTERDRLAIRLFAKISGYYDMFRQLQPSA